MPAAMWLLFAKSFRQQLVENYHMNGEAAKEVTVKAKLKYKQMIQGLPEFEKNDRFKVNAVSCAMPKISVTSVIASNRKVNPPPKQITTYPANMIPFFTADAFFLSSLPFPVTFRIKCKNTNPAMTMDIFIKS